MSIDLLTSQIERLTVEPLKSEQKSAKLPYMFASARALAVKVILDKNKDCKFSLPLVDKVLRLTDSICTSETSNQVEKLRSDLIKVYNVEGRGPSSFCGQVLKAASSVFSFLMCENLLGTNPKFSISEEGLKRAYKCSFWRSAKEKQAEKLVIYRTNQPNIVYSGHILEGLIEAQVELNTLVEDYTLRLDTGEIIGTMPKAIFALCEKFIKHRSYKILKGSNIDGPPYTGSIFGCRKPTYSIVITLLDIKEISLDGFCDIISMLNTGKFSQDVAPVAIVDLANEGHLEAVPKPVNSDKIYFNDIFLKSLLRTIFIHVSNSDFLTCRLVCRAWNLAVQESAAWSSRIFPMNISSGDMPPFAIFFSPVNYNKDDPQWQNIKHRIRDIVRLAQDGHKGAQVELAQRVLSGRGNYNVANSIALDWLRHEDNSRKDYFSGVYYERLECLGMARLDFRSSAKKGYAPAQHQMGIYYQEGKHVEKDLEKAAKWFLRAAEQGYVDAQVNLGDLHYHSNEDESLKWFLRAALQGNAQAQNGVGVILYRKRRDLRDVTEALLWFRRAADQYYTWAFYNLGNVYKYNNEIRDIKEAAKWYLRAAGADPGHAKAQYELGLLCYSGEGVVKNVEEAAKWFFLAAEQGVCQAQYKLANLYFYGEGIPENFEEAFKLYLAAAEQGNRDAQYSIALMYKEGKGVLINPEEAMKWLHSAAKQSHAEACALLGAAYKDGDGVQVNLQQAFEYYAIAAENNHIEAQYVVGIMYANGQGVDVDLEEAFRAHWHSANQGHKLAQHSLGYKYEHGIGVDKDIKAAVKWYEFAALDAFKSTTQKCELEELIIKLRML